MTNTHSHFITGLSVTLSGLSLVLTGMISHQANDIHAFTAQIQGYSESGPAMVDPVTGMPAAAPTSGSQPYGSPMQMPNMGMGMPTQGSPMQMPSPFETPMPGMTGTPPPIPGMNTGPSAMPGMQQPEMWNQQSMNSPIGMPNNITPCTESAAHAGPDQGLEQQMRQIMEQMQSQAQTNADVGVGAAMSDTDIEIAPQNFFLRLLGL